MESRRKLGPAAAAAAAAIMAVAALCGADTPQMSRLTEQQDGSAPLWTFAPGDGATLGAKAFDGDSNVLVGYALPSGGAGMSGASLVLLDADSGAVRWRTPTGFWSAKSLWPVPTGIVALMGDGIGTALWGFDRTSGQEIWSRDVGADESVAGVTGPDIILGGSGTVTAYSAATGEERWTQSAAPGCTFPQASADHDVVAAVETCPDRTVAVVALDGRTGSRRWRRPTAVNFDTESGFATVSVSGPDTETSSGSEEFLSSDGRLILQGAREATADWAAEADGNIIRTHWNAHGVLQMDLIDAATGSIVRSQTAPVAFQRFGNFSSGGFSGRTMFALVGLPSPLLPDALVMLDLDTGRMSAIPLFDAWNSVSGNGRLLLLADDTYQGSSSLTAYRTAVLAQSAGGFVGTGVSWPRACSLLAAGDVATVVGGPVDPIPFDLDVPGLPPASWCTFAPERSGPPTIKVEVQWNGVSAADSEKLVARQAGLGTWTETAGIGDQAYVYRSDITPGAGLTPSSTVVFRANALIVRVSVLGDAHLAEQFARTVADDASRWEGGLRP